MKKKKEGKVLISILKVIWTILWFIIKIPYYIFLGIYHPTKYIIHKARGKVKAKFEDFTVLKTEKGSYSKWIDSTYKADSKIGIIIGARGSGKTAFGVKYLENANTKYNKKCYAMGFNASEMPGFIHVVNDPSEIENDSIVLIDEGGILFSSRNAMSNANKLLSNLILISRHKNLSILFISQNSSNLDVNIIRQADFLILRHSALLQKDFERKIIQKIYEKINPAFEKFEDKNKISYVYSDEFLGFISNSLPSFWGSNISKSFRKK